MGNAVGLPEDTSPAAVSGPGPWPGPGGRSAAAEFADSGATTVPSPSTPRIPPPRRMSDTPNSDLHPDLHHSITLRQRRHDPFRHYEALEIIGFGSMGSITRVRKRADRVGGSARTHNVDPCAGCLNHPLLGRVVRPLLRVRRKCDALEDCCDGGVGVRGVSPTKTGGLGATATGLSMPPVSAGAGAGAAPGGAGGTPSANSSGRAGRKKSKRVLFQAMSSVVSSMTGSIASQTGTTDDGSPDAPGASSPSKYEVHYALKSIHLSRVRRQAEDFLDELRNEVAILRSLDHPHIVRAIETFEHRRQLYVVMELCTGGDLYARDPYTEEEAARIVRMVLSAVSYMHERNVVHRDLKYENIMFANQHPYSDVKIIDFGLSKKFGPDETYLREGVGTIYTMAPQVLEGKYTSACDIWSVGVITYALLSSQVPFFASKKRKLVEKIKKGRYNFKGRRWSHISQQAKDFVSDLLQVDPDVRPPADVARKSLWLNRSFARTVRLPEDIDDDVGASIYNFSKYGRLQKLALMVVAHKSSSEEIGYLRKAFQKYDRGAGVITRSEFRSCLVDCGYSDQELDRMFEAVDIDSNGFIGYTEFLAATIEVHGAINEERLAEAFDRLDCDDSGFISVHNLRSILGDEVPQADIDRIMQEADIPNEEKKISYEDFLALWDVDQERQREDALRSVMARKATVSTASSSFLTSSEKTGTSGEGSGGDSSSGPSSQMGLSVGSSSVRSERSSARPPLPGDARRRKLPTILSPSAQPTESPGEPEDLRV